MAAISASDDLMGMTLEGQKRHWTVVEKVSSSIGQTPGHFSHAYKVNDEEGNEAFLKASDLFMNAPEGANFLDRLVLIGQAHQFERTVLDLCKGNNMDRVVVANDYGDFDHVFGGARDRVFFIVFELAEHDLRHISKSNVTYSKLWTCVALKNLFIGVQQLHSGGVCHNDFKPANCLIFSDDLHKVADLGRATSTEIMAPHDALCLGDVRYAAPEQLYKDDKVTDSYSKFDRSRLGDLYSLGSVIHYVLTHRMVTPEIVLAIEDHFKPRLYYGGWQDSYVTVLPHWRVQFDGLLEKASMEIANDSAIPTEIEKSLLRMVRELCDPDPRLRGHPKARSGAQDKLALNRYVTELDFLAQKAKLLAQ